MVGRYKPDGISFSKAKKVVFAEVKHINSSTHPDFEKELGRLFKCIFGSGYSRVFQRRMIDAGITEPPHSGNS